MVPQRRRDLMAWMFGFITVTIFLFAFLFFGVTGALSALYIFYSLLELESIPHSLASMAWTAISGSALFLMVDIARKRR